jgi:hypothetical protein
LSPCLGFAISLFNESRQNFLKPPLAIFFMWKSGFGERAQISIELIIILAAVVALILLFVSQLRDTSAEGAKLIEEKSNRIFKEIEKI